MRVRNLRRMPRIPVLEEGHKILLVDLMASLKLIQRFDQAASPSAGPVSERAIEIPENHARNRRALLLRPDSYTVRQRL